MHNSIQQPPDSNHFAIIRYICAMSSFTLLTALHCFMRRSTDLESSTWWNSGAVICCHMPHHVHIDGINGSSGLRQLLTCQNVLQCVMPSRLNGTFCADDISTFSPPPPSSLLSEPGHMQQSTQTFTERLSVSVSDSCPRHWQLRNCTLVPRL